MIEDDYDFDFHYESSPILPLASLQHGGQVMYVGSFSKSLAPALRLGFLVGDAGLVHQLAEVRRLIDRTGDPLLERAVSHLLKHGEIKRHFQKSLRAYRSRRDHACKLLQSELADELSFVTPEGGMAAWVGFRRLENPDALWQTFEKNGLSLSHPEAYDQQGGKYTRLGFASCTEEEITQGIFLLKKCIELNRFGK
ncbi:MAG: aminotransferase class I/II-fold pyridoxal phosphate-dependent enzyme [Bacteroidia bacterium]